MGHPVLTILLWMAFLLLNHMRETPLLTCLIGELEALCSSNVAILQKVHPGAICNKYFSELST